jgi:hypothetical protein
VHWLSKVNSVNNAVARVLVFQWFVRLMLVVVVVFSIGCGESSSLLPATGTVTYQGKPVENATVTFVPEKGDMSTGTTDVSGKFEMKTKGKPGANAGKNTVYIAKQDLKGVSTTMTPEDMMKMASKGASFTPKSLLPAKYNDPKNVVLTADVQSGKSTFDFALTD